MTVIFNMGISDKNFYYLSGIEEKCKGVLVWGDEPVVLTSPLESGIAKKYVSTRIIESGKDLWNYIKEELKGSDEVSLNFPKTSISVQHKFKKIGFKKFKDVSSILSKKRSYKTLKEVKKLRRACEIASKSIEKIRDKIKPGVTELELKAELEYLAVKNGADGFSFDTIIASGPNSLIPHSMPTDRVIRSGDSIVIDFGPTYKMYASDLTRTFLVGKNPKFEEVYKKTLNGQLAAIEALEGGVRGSYVTKKAEEHTGPIIHSLGHGVGLDTHELPSFKDSLMNTMVFTIEPGIYKEVGVRIEDVIHMDGSGQLLTHAPKDLDFAKI